MESRTVAEQNEHTPSPETADLARLWRLCVSTVEQGLARGCRDPEILFRSCAWFAHGIGQRRSLHLLTAHEMALEATRAAMRGRGDAR